MISLCVCVYYFISVCVRMCVCVCVCLCVCSFKKDMSLAFQQEHCTKVVYDSKTDGIGSHGYATSTHLLGGFWPSLGYKCTHAHTKLNKYKLGVTGCLNW